MPKVKIIYVSYNYSDNIDDYVRKFESDVTGWEELSEEKLKYLVKNIHNLTSIKEMYKVTNNNLIPVIVVDRDGDKGSELTTSAVIAALEKYEEAKKEVDLLRKKKEAEKLAKARKTKQEKERLEYERLKSLFEDKKPE